MQLLTTEDRREMKGVALQVFMSFSATVASVGAMYFILSILSWYNLLNAGIAYLMSLIGMPIVAVGGMVLSMRLYSRYNQKQAQWRARELGGTYDGELLPDYFIHNPLHMVLAGAVLNLLTNMACYENLLIFWLTGALLAAIFLVGCVVMVKVFQTYRQISVELEALPQKTGCPALPPHSGNACQRR